MALSRNRRRPSTSRLVTVAVVILLSVAGWYTFSGRGAGWLPQDSWGPWREKRVENWSVRIRVNSWSDAAEAYVHIGKAEDFTMKAYGRPSTATTVMDGTRFTLTPGGEVTGQRSREYGAR